MFIKGDSLGSKPWKALREVSGGGGGGGLLDLGPNEDFPNLIDSCFYAVLMSGQEEAMVPYHWNYAKSTNGYRGGR